MKVLGINGSARKDGNTAILIKTVFAELEKLGIETEFIQFSGNVIEPCKACWACGGQGNCVHKKDIFRKVFEKLVSANGIILGSTVYSANISANMQAFLERAAVIADMNKGLLKHKVGASVATARRGGALNTVDAMNHFFLSQDMFVVGSSYWSIAYGRLPNEVADDAEGMETMRNLGQNMAYLLKIMESGNDTMFSFVMFITMTVCGNVPSEETQEKISETVSILQKTVIESEAETSENTEENIDNKTLVVYFSCTGTTKQLAEYAAETLGADIYEIVSAEPYTEEDLAYYTDCRADREQNDPKARTAISGSVENMDGYGTIILGYPIWHGQVPKIVYTFLESYDFSWKTIAPFCTSHSSGIGSSADNLHPLCGDSVTWLEGKRFGGGASESEIREWLKDVGITTITN